MAPKIEDDNDIMELLKEFDTPSIANVVASRHKERETCLGLYDPLVANWHTNQSVRCIFPELGRMAGHVVTAVYGPGDENFDRLSFADVLRAVNDADRPVILCIEQDCPKCVRNKNGLVGGDMAAALKAIGCVGIVSNGPSRDVDEIRSMDFQCLSTGVAPGHGAGQVKAVNVPVSICGMDVAPGEVIHMDANGAVKFPRAQLRNVYECARKLRDAENSRMAALASTSDIEKILKIWEGRGY